MGRFIRIAGIWRKPVFANAMNDGFGGLHRSSVSENERPLRAGIVTLDGADECQLFAIGSRKPTVFARPQTRQTGYRLMLPAAERTIGACGEYPIGVWTGGSAASQPFLPWSTNGHLV